MTKYYAVKRGRKTGIFTDWQTTRKLVNRYSKPLFKSFSKYTDAKRYFESSPSKMKRRPVRRAVTIYTDGGSRNTGNRKHQHVKKTDKSAWAFLIGFKGRYYQGTGDEWGATNNRMEIMALVKALEWLLNHHDEHWPAVEIADSQYVLKAITQGWLSGWQRRGWLLSNGKPLKNHRLWQRMARLLPRFDDLQFKWTKGHANSAGNNFVDHLLNRTMDQMQVHHEERHLRCRNHSALDLQQSVNNIKADLQRLGFKS